MVKMLLVTAAVVIYSQPVATAQAAAMTTQRAAQAQSPAAKSKVAATPTAEMTFPATNSPQKYSEAVAEYQLTVQREHVLGNHKAEAAAAFNLARASETMAIRDPAKLQLAETAYREAIHAAAEAADVPQQALATNNLAVVLLKQGKTTDALTLLQTVDFNAVSPERRPLYNFNFGRTLELNGDFAAAFEKYSAAYAASPEFTEAADAAFRVLQAGKAPRVADAIQVSDALLAAGHADIASGHISRLLLEWGGASDSQRLLAQLLRCYTAQHVTPPEFRERGLRQLDDVAFRFPDLARAIGDVRRAFLGELSPEPLPHSAVFYGWRGEQWKVDSIGPLLKAIGDWYSDQKQYSGALARYATAWNLTRDPAYALAYASLIRRQPDLPGARELVTQLVDSMFMVKGERYRTMDWPNILRMHIAIGTILEDQRRWGDVGDPRSAIFQWTHAIDAEQNVRRANPLVPPAPGLHYRLATCLSAAGQKDEAAREYLAAAALFVKAQDADAATEAIERVTEIGQPIGPDAIRLRDIQAAISRLKGVGEE